MATSFAFETLLCRTQGLASTTAVVVVVGIFVMMMLVMFAEGLDLRSCHDTVVVRVERGELCHEPFGEIGRKGGDGDLAILGPIEGVQR